MLGGKFHHVLTVLVAMTLVGASAAAAGGAGADVYRQEEPPAECRELIERKEEGPQEQVSEPGEVGEEEAGGVAEGPVSPIEENEGLFDEGEQIAGDEEEVAGVFADETGEAFGEEAGVVGEDEAAETEEAGPVEQINEPGELGPEEAVGPAEGPIASEVQDLTERVTALERCVRALIGGPEVAAGEGAAAEEAFAEGEEEQLGVELDEDEEQQLEEFATDEEGLTEEEESQLGVDFDEEEEQQIEQFLPGAEVVAGEGAAAEEEAFTEDEEEQFGLELDEDEEQQLVDFVTDDDGLTEEEEADLGIELNETEEDELTELIEE